MMNFKPSDSLKPSNSKNLEVSEWKQIDNLIDSLIEQERQNGVEPQPPTPEELAKAIAKILPAAIESEIQSNPEAIAKAIAPEIALSIREQILLDETAIPQTLGPEMGKAIKAQIESEKDAMVDALYPVIGSTISKYMVEVVQDINSKIESTLSSEGIRRKLRAKMQGVSEAELIFKESIGYRVRAIFLIDKDSGLVIQEIQVAGEERLDSDMLGGMLTAIRSFANDCIAAGSELDSIDYGNWQIPLEVAGYCYLAVIVAGEPPKEFISKIRQILGEIVLEHDEAIQNFDGDSSKVPFEIRNKLERLIETDDRQERKSSSPLLLWLLIFGFGLILIPWGMERHRLQTTRKIEREAVLELDAAPELSVYRLDPQVTADRLIITGRVPSQSKRDRVQQIGRAIAQQHNLELDNRVLTVNLPVDPSWTAGEIRRLTALFNQQPEVKIETAYRQGMLTVEGSATEESARQITQAFSQIPGVARVVFKLNSKLPQIEQRISFDSGSGELSPENLIEIQTVSEILREYPQVHLKLMAHSDGVGSVAVNQRLAKERCNNVRAALVARGIDSSRLMDSCNLLSGVQNQDKNRAVWSERYISFVPFVPLNPSQ